MLCLKAQGISLQEAAANRLANAALTLHAPIFASNNFEFSGVGRCTGICPERS